MSGGDARAELGVRPLLGVSGFLDSLGSPPGVAAEMLQGSGRDVVYRRRAIVQAARLTGGGFWSKSGACRLEVGGSKLGEGLGHGAELQQVLAGAGRPWRGRSAAEQRRGEAERRGGGG